MGAFVVKNCKVYVGQNDLSGDSNSVTINYEAEMKDRTTFGSGGARRRVSGLTDTKVEWKGFWDSGVGKPEDAVLEAIATGDEVLTVCPVDGVVGERAFFTRVATSSYSPSAQVGELMEFSAKAEGKVPLARGLVVVNGAVTVTGNSGVLNLGKVDAGKKLYAALHILAASGTGATLTARVQSDDSGDFLSPIDRITFPAVGPTDHKAGILSADGPIATDTHWRLQYTVTGDSPSFTIVAVLAIQ